MTLRRRLVLALAVLMVTLVAAGMLVIQLQRRTLLAQLDAQVNTLAGSPRLLLQVARARSGLDPSSAGLSEAYVARLSPSGRWTTLLSPYASEADRPVVGSSERLPTPVTRPVRSGAGGSPIGDRVRVVTRALPDGGLAMVALPQARLEAAIARLRTLLVLTGLVIVGVLALLVFWIERFGLAPITRMTRVADAITAGQRSTRVSGADLTPAGTEAARLGTALNSMVDATTASEDRMQRFVADASHELRTPLTTLRGYAQLHRDDPDLPDLTRDALRRIEAESLRMGRLVDDLLDLTTLDERGLARREPVDISALLRDIVSDLTVLAPAHVVVSHVAEGIVVVGDRDRLVQAVLALTANAARHTPPGTTITVSGQRFGAPSDPTLATSTAPSPSPSPSRLGLGLVGYLSRRPRRGGRRAHHRV